MISKHTVEIEIDWLTGCNYAVISRQMVGTGKEDVRTENWWSDDNYIWIERPQLEPRYKVFCDGSRWVVSEKSAYELARGHFYGEDAERYATEFADKLNREAEE